MPPPVPWPFPKSVASLARPSLPFPSLHPPRLLPPTAASKPSTSHLPFSGGGGVGGGGPSSFPSSGRFWSIWMHRRSVPAVRALGHSKGAFGLAFGSDSGPAARGEPINQRAEAMGTGADSGLDPPNQVGQGEVVNGSCRKDAAPPRLLTLPTVLTIGRVAAVPLLISSESLLV